MTELEKRIYQAIAQGNGIKGADIAKIIGEERKVVNSTLSTSIDLKALVKQDSSFCWWPRNQETGIKTSAGEVSIPVPDVALSNICKYYLNCIIEESGNAVSQFLTSEFDLRYAIIHDLDLDPLEDEDAIALIHRNGSDPSKAVYLGSPVRVFSFKAKSGKWYKKIAPVFLFPISDQGGKIEIASVPMINMEVLKAYADVQHEAGIAVLMDLERELGLDSQNAEIEKDELILRLAEIRQWDYKEQIDPYNLSVDAFTDATPDGIYNYAVVIECDRDPYTNGLESELMTLAKMPTENYKGTALYSWVKRILNRFSERDIKPLLEVLPLNSEQADAVNAALRSDLTIVTGPPGTGKSQVVTDLLINIVWNGKSALFSSKNNKAVDVVDQRVNGLSKRPVVLRMGGTQYGFRLAEIIEGLLQSRPKSSDIADAQEYMRLYEAKSKEVSAVLAEKELTMAARNRLDEIEQRYCAVRDRIRPLVDKNDFPDEKNIVKTAEDYIKAHDYACKDKQSFFVRLFWNFLSKNRLLAEEIASQKYDSLASKYGLLCTNQVSGRENDLLEEARSFADAVQIGRTYKKALDAFSKEPSLESYDRKLSVIKKELADIASKLWGKWLVSQSVSLSAAEREEMSAFVAAMKIAGDVDLSDLPDLKKKYTKMIKQMTKYLQCWAVTSLSARGKVPFEAGLFDYVIIDEASQCDIASILPLLYRAKHAVIIGDPMQLKHISQLSKKQDGILLQKYNVEPNWSYSTNSLYDLAEGKVAPDQIIQLKDHFRCCSDIIEFSNKVFYDGSLRTATKYTGLKTPAGEKPGIRWIDVIGKTVRPYTGSAYNSEEAKAVVKELKRLVSAGYQGSIGVTTPFRRQAEEIRSILEKQENAALYEKLCTQHEFLANTVHTFQGDERDLMLFSPVVSNGTPDRTLGFLESTGNLFNVAITRARAVLVVVGNYQYCSNSNVSYLKKFAEYYKSLSTKSKEEQIVLDTPASREYPWVSNPEQVSSWERDFYTALYDAGIKTIPQYPVEKYKLDLALILGEDKKLDIEVDGEMYHKQWNGELCYRDQLRNQRMFELGWDVKRFWVYQIRDEMGDCINQIKNWARN